MSVARALIVLGVALALAMLASIALGEATIAPDVVLGAFGRGIAGAARDWRDVVILEVRAPRVVLAALTGGGLAVAGAAMQGLFRNPLADPGFLGVSDGAALGAVAALYLAPAAMSLWLVPMSAFAAALGCAYLVHRVGARREGTATLLLAGIAVSTVAGAATSLVLSAALAEWEVGRQMLAWLLGSFDGRSWGHVVLAGPLVVVGSIALARYAPELDALLSGERGALAVGVDVARTRRDVLALASLVTAATVAVVGVIGFVGLVVPHLVRMLVGPIHRRVLPLSFALGGVLMVLADLACRLLPFSELRVGVVTATIGGPFFFWLLTRRGRA